jgi:nitroreductase
MYPQDLSAAIENSLLEACSLGIGSCWCGTYPNGERMQKVREIFDLDNNLEPFAVVGFGYPEDENSFKFVDRFDENKIIYEKVK